MDIRCGLFHKGEDLTIPIGIELRVDTREQADFTDIPACCKPHFLPDCLGIVTECTFIGCRFPERTETTEIFADIGQVKILVSYIGDYRSDLLFPYSVSSLAYTVEISTRCVEKEHPLFSREPVPGHDIREQGAKIHEKRVNPYFFPFTRFFSFSFFPREFSFSFFPVT